jgi:hypothetical protein
VGGFSSAACGDGEAWASSEAFVLLLRCTGCALVSLGSAGLRGFRAFFSSGAAVPSLALGFGPDAALAWFPCVFTVGLPGFLRGCPDAVRRGAGEDPFAGVGVLTPTTPPDTRIVAFGVPCSGECGGELKLPGEEASFASMAKEDRICAESTACTMRQVLYVRKSREKISRRVELVRAQVVQLCAVRSMPGCADVNSTPKVASRLRRDSLEHESWRAAGCGARVEVDGTLKRREEHQMSPLNASLMAAISARAWLMKLGLQVHEFVQEGKREKRRRGRDVDVFKNSGALRLMYGKRD